MGNLESQPQDSCPEFSSEEISRLTKRYCLYNWVHFLHDVGCFRFKKLDADGSGSLTMEEFLSLPELMGNPIVQRVVGKFLRIRNRHLSALVDVFDDDKNGEVNFKEFLQGLSAFSAKGQKEAKLRFAFRIYDMDNDGFISNGELYQVTSGRINSS